MTDKGKVPGSELFDQALKNYEQTLRSGLQLQEEAGRWWTNLLTQATSAQDWQKRVSTASKEVIPPMQKRIEEYLTLCEENTRTNIDLLRKAITASQCTAPSELQAECVEFLDASVSVLQANVQAVTQINNKMVDSWVSFIKKNSSDFVEPKAAKA